MRKFLVASLFLLIVSVSVPAFALLETNNVDVDNFNYMIAYQFASADIAASLTARDIPILNNTVSTTQLENLYFTVHRPGNVVGISVAGNAPATAGGATFDVTINNQVTGIQAVIEVGPDVVAVGIDGSSDQQYAYRVHDRRDSRVAPGFYLSGGSPAWHDLVNAYGKATALVAGNQIGVEVTTHSTFAPANSDYVIVVYVLE